MKKKGKFINSWQDIFFIGLTLLYLLSIFIPRNPSIDRFITGNGVDENGNVHIVIRSRSDKFIFTPRIYTDIKMDETTAYITVKINYRRLLPRQKEGEGYNYAVVHLPKDIETVIFKDKY